MCKKNEPYLCTLGHLALRHGRAPARTLRRKDAALLAYLCLEGERTHPRGLLAALLWGDSPERRARHSLTQALGRLQKALGAGMLAPEKDGVGWKGGLPCDATVLLAGDAGHPEVDDALTLYAGHFLEGFGLGPGAKDFEAWADRTRDEVRNTALRLLEQRGQAAEAAGEWERALAIGERAVEIDPVWEQGRRRVMRALIARGEQARALRYYQEFEAWLAGEVGAAPDPDTRALAERLLSSEPRPAAPAAREPEHSAAPPLPPPSPPAAADPALEAASPAAPARGRAGRAWLHRLYEPRRPWPARMLPVLLPVLLSVPLALLIALSASGSQGGERPPASGETIRQGSGGPVFLAFNGTLYEYPDSATLSRCVGAHPERIRQVGELPPWERRRMPSVLQHGWLGSGTPVHAAAPGQEVPHVSVGCVLTPLHDSLAVREIYGKRGPKQAARAGESLLAALPQTVLPAHPYPIRPPGTLLRSGDGSLRWVLYHGGAYAVSHADVLATYCRGPEGVVQVTDAEFRYYQARAELPPASGPCRLGPDEWKCGGKDAGKALFRGAGCGPAGSLADRGSAGPHPRRPDRRRQFASLERRPR